MSIGVVVITPGWVAGEYIKSFTENPNTHIAAIAAFSDSQRKRAAEYSKKFGLDCPVTDTLEEALVLEDVKIASVCSINCFPLRAYPGRAQGGQAHDNRETAGA